MWEKKLKLKLERVNVEHWRCKMRKKEDFSHPFLAIKSIELS
jgi:hypothetical protein